MICEKLSISFILVGKKSFNEKVLFYIYIALFNPNPTLNTKDS